MKKMNASVLIIDDNEDVLLSAKILLKNKFETVITLSKSNKVLSFLNENSVDVILLDMNFKIGFEDGKEGIYILKEIKQNFSKIPVILMTAFSNVETAIEGIKLGAWDYLLKPWDNNKLLEILKMALEKHRKSQKENTINKTFNCFIGTSESMQTSFKMANRVAPTDASVLILGENGTGKYVMANYIHEHSVRKNKPFVAIDLGSINESIFESELFGYAKGAFTDAKIDTMGKLEIAQSGTVFLDEIGNISAQMQAKLLHVIQTKTIVRLGETQIRKLDIRFIFATNIDIHDAIKNKNFREDLYYRINTFEIQLPPLRARISDILPLTNYFIEQLKVKYQFDDLKIEEKAQDILCKHYWPGNIRELENRLERAVILSENKIITTNDLDLKNYHSFTIEKDDYSLEEIEKHTIEKALIKNENNISKTALELGLSRAALYRRIEKFNLSHEN